MADVPVQSDPVLSSAAAAIDAANQNVAAAQARLHATQPYTTGSAPNPQMPVPSLRSNLFSGASVRNLDNERPVTRQGARNKAVGMLAAQGASFIGAYMRKKEAEKQQALAMDIHRSLELQTGIDEAAQSAESAKAVLNDPSATPEAKAQANAQLQQAQAISQKNNKLLEALLNGKSGKDIAKAYDITFGEESKDKAINDKTADMHYNAMQDALKQAKLDQAKMTQAPQLPPPGGAAQMGAAPNLSAPNAPPQASVDPGLSRLQQFQNQLPARMMTNPNYERAMQDYNNAVKNAEATRKNTLDYVSKYQKDQTELQKQQLHDLSQAQIHEADAQVRADIAKMQADSRVQAAKIGAGAREFAAIQGLKAAEIKASATLKLMGQMKNDQMKAKLAVTQIGQLQSSIDKGQATVDQLNKELSNANRNKKNDENLKSQIKAIGDDIEKNKQRINDLRMVADQDPEAANTMSLLGEFNTDSQAPGTEEDSDN